jgi:hemolysin III
MAARSASNIASITINASAAVLGIVGLVVLLANASTGRALAGSLIYGLTLILAYGTSTLYHFNRDRERAALFQAADHCAIYLLIAGTYTPLALLPLWDHRGLILLAAVWGLGFAGLIRRIFWIRRLHRAAPVFYVLLGWIGLGWAEPFAATLGRMPLMLLLTGGVAYTAGAAFVSRNRTAFDDVLWHLCAVAGSACHFAAILWLLRI